jgi:hypothetical protein
MSVTIFRATSIIKTAANLKPHLMRLSPRLRERVECKSSKAVVIANPNYYLRALHMLSVCFEANL